MEIWVLLNNPIPWFGTQTIRNSHENNEGRLSQRDRQSERWIRKIKAVYLWEPLGAAASSNHIATPQQKARWSRQGIRRFESATIRLQRGEWRQILWRVHFPSNLPTFAKALPHRDASVICTKLNYAWAVDPLSCKNHRKQWRGTALPITAAGWTAWWAPKSLSSGFGEVSRSTTSL